MWIYFQKNFFGVTHKKISLRMKSFSFGCNFLLVVFISRIPLYNPSLDYKGMSCVIKAEFS